MNTIKILKNYNEIPYKIINEKTNQKVEILRINEEPNDKKIYGINWSAYGDSTIEQTYSYIKLLNKAIKIVNKLNK